MPGANRIAEWKSRFTRVRRTASDFLRATPATNRCRWLGDGCPAGRRPPGGATGYPDRFLPANTRTPPITMAATPKMGVTIPRSCVVTFRGPTSTSLWLFVYGTPRIATTMTPATMRSTPIQPSGRMNTPQTGSHMLRHSLCPCKARDAISRLESSLFMHEFPVSNTVRPVRVRSLPLLEVLGVLAITPLKPHRLRIPLEREYVRRDAVQKPAIVRDDNGASREIDQRLFERAQRVDVEIVRGFVEQQQVAA